MNRVFAIVIFMFCSVACLEQDKKTKNLYLCDQLDEEEIQTLKGILNINSTGDFVFQNMEYRDTWQRKTHLIPCDESLENYILSTYDSYLYLKNFDEKFWILAEGNYITSDTLDEPPEFLFSFVAIIDEQEALTDSSNALRGLVKDKIKHEHTTK